MTGTQQDTLRDDALLVLLGAVATAYFSWLVPTNDPAPAPPDVNVQFIQIDGDAPLPCVPDDG